MFSKGFPGVRLVFLFICSVFFSVPSATRAGDRSADTPVPADRIFLHEGWALQSSCLFLARGEQISTAGYKTNGWHSATVPTTVVAALVADKTYPDPYYGKNLRDIPGTTYPIGKNFSLLSMPKESPFRCSWWYRTEFTLPARLPRPAHLAEFRRDQQPREHLAERAKDSRRKGHRRAPTVPTNSTYTARLYRDGPNVLAVETIAQTEKDLGINWVDWNPAPPDKDMGLWRERLCASERPVAIRHPQVVTHFPGGFLERADLTVEAEVSNAGASKVAAL